MLNLRDLFIKLSKNMKIEISMLMTLILKKVLFKVI